MPHWYPWFVLGLMVVTLAGGGRHAAPSLWITGKGAYATEDWTNPRSPTAAAPTRQGALVCLVRDNGYRRRASDGMAGPSARGAQACGLCPVSVLCLNKLSRTAQPVASPDVGSSPGGAREDMSQRHAASASRQVSGHPARPGARPRSADAWSHARP